MSTSRMPADLLLDSEASLRLADGLLGDLRPAEPRNAPATAPAQPAARPLELNEQALAGLPEVLLRAYHEINAILGSLRQCRSVLERTTVTRLHRTQEKLREVSSATETAANSMLDGLDRALVLVDGLDVAAGDDAESKRGALRNELHQLVSCLQFQDITSQQLGYATNVLEEVEARMASVAELLDASPLEIIKLDTADAATEPRTFDPAASTLDADSRQAVADSIFHFGGA